MLIIDVLTTPDVKLKITHAGEMYTRTLEGKWEMISSEDEEDLNPIKLEYLFKQLHKQGKYISTGNKIYNPNRNEVFTCPDQYLAKKIVNLLNEN